MIPQIGSSQMPSYQFQQKGHTFFVSTCRNFAGIHSLRIYFTLILQPTQTVAILKLVLHKLQSISQNLTTGSTPHFGPWIDSIFTRHLFRICDHGPRLIVFVWQCCLFSDCFHTPNQFVWAQYFFYSFGYMATKYAVSKSNNS